MPRPTVKLRIDIDPDLHRWLHEVSRCHPDKNLRGLTKYCETILNNHRVLTEGIETTPPRIKQGEQ